MVVLNLTERGIYLDFELWYNYFFDTNGVVVQIMQAANMTNETVSNETASSNETAPAADGLGSAAAGLAGGATAVPAGMESIAAWIIAQINIKISQIDILKYFNATGVNMTMPEVVPPVVVPPSSGGEVTPPAVMILAPSKLFNSSEYQASSTCQLQTAGDQATNDTICCNDQAIGVNGTQFCQSLAVMGQEWVMSVGSMCGNISNI